MAIPKAFADPVALNALDIFVAWSILVTVGWRHTAKSPHACDTGVWINDRKRQIEPASAR